MSSEGSFADILRTVCETRGWELLPSGVNVVHPDGRHQLVGFEIVENDGRTLVRLVSTIGGAAELRTEHLEQALRANMSLAHGALALEGDELCMTDTLSLEESDPGEVEDAVAYLAKMADTYEQILFGTDKH